MLLADISRIENGTRNPSLSMVKKTCTGIRDAIKAGICSDANKKLNVKSMRIISAEISIFNQNLYFQNPDYLEGSYREEKIVGLNEAEKGI